MCRNSTHWGQFCTQTFLLLMKINSLLLACRIYSSQYSNTFLFQKHCQYQNKKSGCYSVEFSFNILIAINADRLSMILIYLKMEKRFINLQRQVLGGNKFSPWFSMHTKVNLLYYFRISSYVLLRLSMERSGPQLNVQLRTRTFHAQS